MRTEIASVQNRSVGTAVLAMAAVYVLFVFSYVWFLPNYNLARLGGMHRAGSQLTLTAAKYSNYQSQADQAVWLEKISKTTPENKRATGLVLFGTLVIFSLAALGRSLNELLNLRYRAGSGYGIFAHQYAYLSLRTFRI